MGTLVQVTIPGAEATAKAVAEDIFSELKRVEDLTSFHKPSGLTKINDQSGNGPIKADPELLSLIGESLRFAKETQGAFDPTVGPLTRLWNFSAGDPRLPSGSEITAALAKIGWRRVTIDSTAGTITLPDPGMALDLGGIAKGYALQRAAAIIRKRGISAALVNAGGDVLVVGEREPGKPWRIGVQDPRNERCHGRGGKSEGLRGPDLGRLRTLLHCRWEALSPHSQPRHRLSRGRFAVGYRSSSHGHEHRDGRYFCPRGGGRFEVH